MKSLLFYSFILAISFPAFSQWTEQANGTDLTTGDKVGIGISTPLSNVVINGGTVNDIIWPLWVQNSKNNSTVSGYGVGIKLKHSSNSELHKWGGIASVQETSWANTSGLALYSNEAERVRIKANGNVGIGTTNPMAQLHVYETSQLGSSIGNTKLLTRVSGRASNTFMNNHWLVRDASGSDWLTARLHDGISVDASYLDPGTNTRTWWERDPYNRIQSWGNGSSTYMTLKGDRLGISTTTPLEKLQVNNGALQFYQLGSNDNVEIIKIAESTTHDEFELQGMFNGGGETGNSIKWRSTWNDNLMVLRGDGNVGIGASNPTNKLEVNGTIRSKEVKVEASPWPDYVFAPTYHLRSLEETEAFIQANSHLPEVPSAEEVEENGIQLGEMNALLLKKIEELTLHAIEQEKQLLKYQQNQEKIMNLITAQQNEIQELKKD